MQPLIWCPIDIRTNQGGAFVDTLDRTMHQRKAVPMKPSSTLPTGRSYGDLDRAYQHFNQRLFEVELPDGCLIAFQRQKARLAISGVESDLP